MSTNENDPTVPLAVKKLTQQDVDNIKTIENIKSGVKNAITTDSPIDGIDTYNVGSAGTYTSFGGLEVVSGDLDAGQVQLRRKIDGSWEKVVIPIDLTDYLKKSDNGQLETIYEAISDFFIKEGLMTTGDREDIYFLGIYGWGGNLERNDISIIRKASIFRSNAIQTKSDDNFIATLYGSNDPDSIGTLLSSTNFAFDDFNLKDNNERFEIDFGANIDVTPYTYIGLGISYDIPFSLKQTYISGTNIVTGFYQAGEGAVFGGIASNEYGLAFEVYGGERKVLLKLDPDQLKEVNDEVETLDTRVSVFEDNIVITPLKDFFIKTVTASVVYLDASIYGWGSQIFNYGVKSLRNFWVRRSVSGFPKSNDDIELFVYGSNISGEIGVRIAKTTFDFDTFASLADNEEMMIDFGYQIDVSKYMFLTVFMMYDAGISMKQCRGQNLTTGFYSNNGVNVLVAGLDAGDINGLYWEASPSYLREKKNSVNYFQLPETIQNYTEEILTQARTMSAKKDIELIKEVLKADKDIYLMLYGDSITAWQSTFAKSNDGVCSSPPVCDRLGFANRVYNSLKFGNTNYRRFDFGKKSLVDFWDPQWNDDSLCFFNETGVWKTFYNGGEGRPVNMYSTPQYTTEVTNEVCPIASFHDVDFQRNIPKRISATANASITFVIPAGYEKADFIYHEHLDGDLCNITITGGNGKLLVNTKQNDWGNAVEANNYNLDTVKHDHPAGNNDSTGVLQKRIYFKKTNIADTIIVTITKSANTSKYLMYWGMCYFGTIDLPYSLHIIASGRGGFVINDLLTVVDSDVRMLNPDCLFFENTLINNFGTGSDPYRNAQIAYRNSWVTLNNYINSLSIPVCYIIPHTTKTVMSINEEASVNFYNGIKGFILDNDEDVLDARMLMFSVWDNFYKNQLTLVQFIQAMMYDATTHPNEKGFDIYQALIESVKS